MKPPPPNAGKIPLLAATDAFNVPISLHLTKRPITPMARRPSKKKIDSATATWPFGTIPTASQVYTIPTTWLQIVTSAIAVGRDIRPWLVAAPHLAIAELLARVYPLHAYLALDQTTAGRVVANPIYTVATERSAKASVGYRLGMTMADWMCRAVIGLGPTRHAEYTKPTKHGKGWSNKSFQPDLVCNSLGPRPWLVEAKGGGRVTRQALVKGAKQLNAPKLMAGPHRRMLCGASLDHRLHMTVDLDLLPRRKTGTDGIFDDGDSSEADWNLVLSQLTTYYALTTLPEQLRAIVTVDRATALDTPNWLPRTLDRANTVTDQDVETAYIRSGDYSTQPMIVGDIPGTGLTLGMSARMFAACEALAGQDALTAATLEQPRPFPVDAEDSADDQPVQRRRRSFDDAARAREAETRDLVLSTLDSRDSAPIVEVLQGRPAGPGRTVAATTHFEAATTDTYIAIRRTAVPVIDDSTR